MDQLLGITSRHWLELLRENNFQIAPQYAGRVAFLTLVSLYNSGAARKEQKLFGKTFKQTQIERPLFIIGHWRSGTTLLHDLLARDQQFTYPTIFQTSNPHTFLHREERIYQRETNHQTVKRPMDNMEFTANSPGEDEFAVSAASLRSPLVGWSFPKNEAFYDRFLTFYEATPQELKRWKAAFVTFLQKVSWKNQRPLILKSPGHTARIRILLDLFPDARFIHIRRNPFDVFRSTQGLYQKGIPRGYLQEAPGPEQINAGIIRRYAETYQAFFEQSKLVPEGQITEICFENLEKDMLNQVKQIYAALAIPGFEAARPALERYIASLQGYKKNRHAALPEVLRKQIIAAWEPCFEAWNYSTNE